MYFVVIVEPEEVNAERIRAILESVDKSFEYELTDSPEKAIEILENKEVDVFISSIELAVMTGAELFSMVEMISPDTVRIAMTSPNRIAETVNCMNQSRTYKVIIKPCRVADDLLSPIEASINYKEMCQKVNQEEEDANMGFFSTERDLKSLTIAWRAKIVMYQRIQAVLEKVFHKNIEISGMDAALEKKLKKWYDWMVSTYFKTMIDSDGLFESAESSLRLGYHCPEAGKHFHLRKNFEGEIAPQKMNEIAFVLFIIAEACRECVGNYKIAAIIEDSDKAYVLRAACALPNKKESYAEQDEKTRKVVAKAAEECIAALGKKSVTIHKENEVVFNIALRK